MPQSVADTNTLDNYYFIFFQLITPLIQSYELKITELK